VSAQDTDGAMSVFEFNCHSGGPRHLHCEQHEWIYLIEGDFEFHIGKEPERCHLTAGESIFIPRQTAHAWASANGKPGKILNVYQPAGKMEEFFRELGKYDGKPYVHEALSIDEFRRLFHDHGMDLLGPPLLGEWKVEEDGQITQTGFKSSGHAVRFTTGRTGQGFCG
jgi:quercetin dioxygenase-like cupin family protein